MTDREMLCVLLGEDDLREDEERAFREMLGELQSGARARLSIRQRAWVTERLERCSGLARELAG